MTTLAGFIWVVLVLLCSRLVTKKERSRYRYCALKSTSRTIRLLRVLSGAGEISHASLEEMLLDDVSGQYDAISYVWGKPEPHRSVVINGKELPVRDNIYQCLKHLRQYRMLSRPLWIDCICINQADTTEKEQQIAKMSKIFSSAKTVYIWLGDTSRLFQPNQSLGHAVLRKVLNDTSRRDLLEKCVERQDAISLAVIDQLMRLVYNEYWHRLWVVQEVSLASDARVIMGNVLIDYKALVDVYIVIRSVSKPGYYAWLRRQNDVSFEDRGLGILDTHPIAGIWDQLKEPEGLELTELIKTYRTKLCTDPRDRIYGLLGLTRSRQTPPVDYKCSAEILLVRTLNCLIAEAEEKFPDKFDNTYGEVLKFDSWIVACVLQSLETTAQKVLSAIATPSAISQEYMRQFEVTIQASEVVSSGFYAPRNQKRLETRYVSVQAPSGRIEHFKKCWTCGGHRAKKKFRMKNKGIPLLICCIGIHPTLLLSIDKNRQVQVERLISYDVSRRMDQHVQYRSRYTPPSISQALNTKLNLLKTDWQDVFDGAFYRTRISLSVLELVELAETWDLHKIKYDTRDRDLDWKMTLTAKGEGPHVDDIAQVLRDSMEIKL